MAAVEAVHKRVYVAIDAQNSLSLILIDKPDNIGYQVHYGKPLFAYDRETTFVSDIPVMQRKVTTQSEGGREV